MDKENFVLTSIKAREITLTPNFNLLLNTYREKQTKLVRVHINLTEGETDKKIYLAIIALRIRYCLR